MGDYHLSGTGSSAFNLGAANKTVPSYQQPAAPTPYQATGTTTLNAPTTDIDNQSRPSLGGFDSGADEFPGAQADLSITKDDGVTSVSPGTAVHYTITLANNGPSSVALAPVTDTVPAALTGVTWTCTAPGGSVCGAASGSGNINTTVSLPMGGSATFTLNGTVAANASGTLANTATVATPAGTTDTNTANNSATDSDTIAVPRPTLTVLDTFNRSNAANLNTGAPAGVGWSQTTSTMTVIRVNANQANCALLGNCLLGTAIWNGTTNVFGAKQGAALTFTSTPAAALYLKASGGSANAPASFIRVRPSGTQVIVETTTNSGGSFTNRGTFAGANFGNGDRLTALANADGSVDVWRTTAANVTTYLGHSAAVAAFTGTGRIGMQLLVTALVDNFAGGTVP
jgi:uncharacterized repeat protein (TIGR01451 family)